MGDTQPGLWHPANPPRRLLPLLCLCKEPGGGGAVHSSFLHLKWGLTPPPLPTSQCKTTDKGHETALEK